MAYIWLHESAQTKPARSRNGQILMMTRMTGRRKLWCGWMAQSRRSTPKLPSQSSYQNCSRKSKKHAHSRQSRCWLSRSRVKIKLHPGRQRRFCVQVLLYKPSLKTQRQGSLPNPSHLLVQTMVHLHQQNPLGRSSHQWTDLLQCSTFHSSLNSTGKSHHKRDSTFATHTALTPCHHRPQLTKSRQIPLIVPGEIRINDLESSLTRSLADTNRRPSIEDHQ